MTRIGKERSYRKELRQRGSLRAFEELLTEGDNTTRANNQKECNGPGSLDPLPSRGEQEVLIVESAP